MLNYKRYQRNPVMDFPERTWPNKEIEKAPKTCSELWVYRGLLH